MRDSLPLDYIAGIRDLPCDTGTSFGQKKQLLSVSAFNLELGDINRTVIPCGVSAAKTEEDIGVLFIMGDARKNPLYTTGTGAQTGVREVMHFNAFLDRQQRHASAKSAAGEASGPVVRLTEDDTSLDSKRLRSSIYSCIV